MERSKVFLWVLVLAMAGIIVWRVGFYKAEGPFVPGLDSSAEAASSPESETTGPNEPADANAPDVADANDPAQAGDSTGPNKDPNEPAIDVESNAPTPDGDRDAPADRDRRRMGGGERRPEGMRPDARPDEAGIDVNAPAADPNEPNEPMEAVNLKNVEMKKIIEKIATWTGMTVIPHEEAEKQRITIYAPEKLPRAKALSKIYSALRMKGFVIEEVDDTIFIKPIADAKLGTVPAISADEPLAMIENKDQIVRKFFSLEHYPTEQMMEVVKPLVAEYGYVGADETTGSLLVIETVRNLMSIERIIDQFDVLGAGQTVEEFFEINNGDPGEIVQLLRMLLGEAPTMSNRGRNYNRGRSVRAPSRSNRGRQSSDGASSVLISTGDIPIVLIPVPKAKWIIARGSTDDIKQIGQWIEKLDRTEPVATESETVPISYANPREVATRIEDALQDMPGQELRPSILVRPLEESRQIMIFGRPDLRDMVKKLIAEIDVPTGIFETKVFDLKYADPEQIKENIDSLYGEGAAAMRDPYAYYRWGRGSRGQDSETVKVIEFNTLGQVTVIASPENMRKIEDQIKDWDVPLDVDAVKPRIIELKNSDPVEMADLLTRLFSEDDGGSSSDLLRMVFRNDFGTQRKKIVGPLYGQLTFENVPGTKKIIVVSKIPEAYSVIEQLIYELDRQEMAEIPNVVQLKYADPEDLSERLNAMFNEPGTTATIRRTPRGLQEYTTDDRDGGQNRNTNNNNNRNQGNENRDEYTPPWSGGGSRRDPDQEPISNVIGQVRFVPDPRSKSILVLAPPEFQENIAKTIQMLDTPGKQVMVKAVIVEVDHRDMTSLGVQLSSNPAEVFGDMDENAVTALSSLTLLEERGSGTIQVGTDITAMINFLVKTVNAKILNQQTLWTQDNEEASLFKGDRVAFQTNFSVSEQGGRVTTNFEFQDVGMTLAVRPSITPDKDVDMMLTVLLSQLTGDTVNGQPLRRVMETTTNMIVDDGQTLMLGGILFQTDSNTQRKVPLLGDLPLLGPVFRDYEVSKANNEMIVFITPYVIDDAEGLSESTAAQIEEPKEKLDGVRKDLDRTSEKLRKKLEKD